MNQASGWMPAVLTAAIALGGLPAFGAGPHDAVRRAPGTPSGSPAVNPSGVRQAVGSGHSPAHPIRQTSGASLLDALRSLGRGVTQEYAAPPASSPPMDDWSHLSHAPRPGTTTRSTPKPRSTTAADPSRSRPAGLPRPIDVRELDTAEKRIVRSAPSARRDETPSARRDDDSSSEDATSRRSSRRGVTARDGENRSSSSALAPNGASPATAAPSASAVPRVSRRPLPRATEEEATDQTPQPGVSSRRRTAAQSPSGETDAEAPAAGARPIPSIGAQTAGAGAFEARESARRSVAPVPTERPASTPAAASAADHLRSTVSEIPAVRVTTRGPSQIPINQPVTYEINVENRGALDAPGLLVRATLPVWSAVRGHQASRGEIEAQPGERVTQILWQIDQLPAGGTEKLALRLEAQRAEAFDVKVEWTLVPQTNTATVHVQQPKLKLLIEGPDSVNFGTSQVYTVRVLNPGSGSATDVSFTLSPNSATPQTQRLGDIPAGKEAQFEVELTAQDRGKLEIHGLVTGDGGLRSESLKQIEVASADLVATLDGPQLKYQNTEALYHLVLTNSGDAESRGITASIRLPKGVEYIEGIAGAELTAEQLRWQVERLAPGQSVEYDVLCRMQAPGAHLLAFQCDGSAAGTASVSIATQVEALADLKLSVDDPEAPSPVGEEVVYEIVVHNRGSKAATDVQAVAQFSHGIEPMRAEGQPGELLPGQVLFEPIPRIEAGQEVRLRVIAKADSAGVHRFRTEITSGDTLLVAEEATRYITLSSERISRRSADPEEAAR